MSPDVASLPHDSYVYEAVRAMGKRRIGSVIVEDKGVPVGIFTERDLLCRVMEPGKDPRSLTLATVMSTPLLTTPLHASTKEAAQAMIQFKGKLVVMREGKILGIVTASDLIKTMPDVEETKVPVSHFMTKKVVVTDYGTSLLEVVHIMAKKRIGSLIVEKENQPYGIFTERDLVSKLLLQDVSLARGVGEFASRPMVVINPDTSVHRGAAIMGKEHVRRLPVVERETAQMVGIVTARDLVEAYAK